MNEELELVKLELENTNDLIDVKRNPVIESLLSPIKKIPYIGSLLNTAVELKMSEFQRQKENELIDVETIAGQMNSIGKMIHGMIPELVMGGTFTRDSVANYLNTRIYVGE